MIINKNIRLNIFTVLVLVFCGLFPLTGRAQSDSTILSEEDTLTEQDYWSDEQFDKWNDSLIEAMYPTPEIGYTHVPDSVVDSSSMKKTENVKASLVTTATLSVSVGTSNAVGKIPIVQGTTPMGGATYQVPIDVYPGPKGIQPNLSLGYNSAGGNGALGIGWGLSGISKITRSNRSIYYDKKTAGIKMTLNDAFVLDGMRLIWTGAKNNQFLYESEQGNIKVIGYVSSYGKVAYFKVLYPNGTQAIFGVEKGPYGYWEYPLTKLTDLHGNTVKYTYSCYCSNYLVTQITYGDNGGASVTFEYSTNRADPVVAYRGGTKLKENRLLTKIHCKYGSTVLHTYGIIYKTVKNCSAISQITYTANGQSFNPLTFNYGTGNTASSYSTKTTQLLEWYKTDKPGPYAM